MQGVVAILHGEVMKSFSRKGNTLLFEDKDETVAWGSVPGCFQTSKAAAGTKIKGSLEFSWKRPLPIILQKVKGWMLQQLTSCDLELIFFWIHRITFPGAKLWVWGSKAYRYALIYGDDKTQPSSVGDGSWSENCDVGMEKCCYTGISVKATIHDLSTTPLHLLQDIEESFLKHHEFRFGKTKKVVHHMQEGSTSNIPYIPNDDNNIDLKLLWCNLRPRYCIISMQNS